MKISRNNIKLTFSRPRYYVDEKKKLVKCSLSAHLLLPYIEEEDGSGRYLVDTTCNGFRTKQVATCQGSDEFSVEKGKKIAIAKAENELYRKALSYLKWHSFDWKTMRDICDIFENFAKKTEAHNKHNLDYIESITD